ncbi:MAG: InlB B-repeat-containing protein, partial [Clostridia bacterium]|nr:InlB B-repeat-containing protein [Clostridia bacterium]
YDHGATSSRRVGNVSTVQAGGLVAAQKRMFAQTDYDIDDFLVDDCNHTFTIGKPSAGGKEYTATFTVDGETYGEPVTVKKGAEIAAPADAPVKAGYAFNGWALEGTTDVLTFPQTMGEADVTYVAIFTALPKYTATFYADGVQVGEVNEYYEGDTIVAPQAPDKTGYTFVEWAPEVGVMPAENVVFNAVYEAKTYTATWVVDGATYDTTTATYDAAYVLPTAPSKEGHTFAGWYADADYNTAIAATHTVDGNVTFYAKFTTDSFTITFDTDGGSAIAPATYAFGATVVEPTAPTKTGFTFSGWSPALPTTMPAQNITVVAQWTAVDSGVTFMDGDVVIENIPGKFGDVITAAMVPAMSKDGFNFTGWKDAQGNTVTFPQTLGTEALVVYAQWTAKSYYIEFYNGDEWLAGNNQACGNVIVTPDEPTKTGYKFAGWVDGDGNPMPETVPAVENQVYFATFRAELYDAVFMNGTEVHDTVQGAYQSEINAPADPEMEGYTFQYWAKEGTTAKVNFPAKMPLNGVKYVAIYKVNTYTITYYVDQVEVFSEEYDFGEAVTPYDYKPAEGVTFTGWGDQVPATMPAHDVDVYASTGIANYTVTFTINGEPYDEIEFAYGAAVTAPAYSIPEGYSFSGWDLPATMPAQNLTLDATLTINSYWARWYLDAEKTILYHEEKFEYGAEIVFPEDPTEADIPGHTFDIWDDDTITEMPVGGVDYVAMTNPIEYTITFLNEDGSAIDGAEWIAYYGDEITAEDAPVVTKEGFEFKGWAVDGTVVTLPYTVTGDTTFTATFGIVSYDVIWVVDGKTLYTDPYDFGDAIVMRAPEEKEGYTFSGWDKDLTGMTMPAEDITVTGSFTVNVYNALFYADNALIDTVPTNFGEIPAAPQAPEKTGYAFIGWTPSLAPMVVAPEGVRYDAVYSAGAVGYSVEIYTMDTEGVYGAPEVIPMSAEADAPISYAPAAKTGFTVSDDSVLEGTAAADGSSVLKVYYSRNQYNFTTVVDGEDEVVTYYFEAAVAAPAAPSKTGYDFLGWDGTVPATMPARDVTLTARFKIQTHTITYNTNGGTLIPSFTADYGTVVVAPAAPTKTGYTFAGWDGEIPATIPEYDVTLNAQWTINQYTITFVDTGDVAYEDIKQDYDTVIDDVADPVKTGYTFTGWSEEIPGKMPAKDMTITATWKVNQYPATFIINGESKDYATDFGTMPVAPEAVKYGYTFTGWVAADGQVYASNALPVMGTDGATYTAQFDANVYDAIFDADGGKWADGATSVTVKDVIFGTAVTAPAEDPAREGYIFSGWTPADLTMDVEGGKTFKAVWTQDLNFCRVQSVERITADVYGPALAQYAIKVMGNPVKLQIAYADATDVTWTFDRNDAKVAGDNSTAGLVSIVAYNEGTPNAYEIWTICTVLTEDSYKVRAKVDYTSASWESLAFAYDYEMTYDEVPVAATMVYSAVASADVIKRGTSGTITIETDASVTRLQLRMKKTETTYTTVTFAPTSSAVSYDDSTKAAENKAIWVITLTFTYAGTAESQDQSWAVWYRTSLTDWVDSAKTVDVKVTRLAIDTAEPAPGQAPYSVISVSIDKTNVAVAEATTITIVTTNDITRVRLNNTAMGKTATYLKTAKNNVVVTEDAEAGTYEWKITYRFGAAGENQEWFAQCRGTSWSALDKSFTVTVTE